MKSFVTAFNGSRDYYELPRALMEVGKLAAHVSDFYIPDCLSRLVRRGKISNRKNSGLPSRKVITSLAVAFYNYHLKKFPNKYDPRDPYLIIDKELSVRAARAAVDSDSDLFLHSGNAYWAFSACSDRQKLLFQFHPHPLHTYEVLEEDYNLHPEIAHSFMNEADSQSPEDYIAERTEEWKLADRILCASSFTKNSLVNLGANPDNVIVCPYGADNLSDVSDVTIAKGDKCRFLFVGQGVQRKGLHHLLKAWKRIYMPGIELIVVAKRIDPGLTSLLNQKGVIYHPGVSQYYLNTLYSSCDYFVMPSLVEGFGLVYLEALRSGLPCIGTFNTGLPDLELSDEFVLLLKAGEIDQLVDILNEAFCRWRLGEIDKRRVAKSIDAFTWKKHRKGIVNFVVSSS